MFCFLVTLLTQCTRKSPVYSVRTLNPSVAPGRSHSPSSEGCQVHQLTYIELQRKPVVWKYSFLPRTSLYGTAPGNTKGRGRPLTESLWTIWQFSLRILEYNPAKSLASLQVGPVLGERKLRQQEGCEEGLGLALPNSGCKSSQPGL